MSGPLHFHDTWSVNDTWGQDPSSGTTQEHWSGDRTEEGLYLGRNKRGRVGTLSIQNKCECLTRVMGQVDGQSGGSGDPRRVTPVDGQTVVSEKNPPQGWGG